MRGVRLGWAEGRGQAGPGALTVPLGGGGGAGVMGSWLPVEPALTPPRQCAEQQRLGATEGTASQGRGGGHVS